jgi:hypothetical protein
MKSAFVFAILAFGCSSSESSPPASVDSSVDSAQDASGEVAMDGAETDVVTRTTCGGVPVLGPQGHTVDAKCASCTDTKCCAEGTACGANAECKAMRECYLGCSDSKCFNDCAAAHPDGDKDDLAFSGCRRNNCAVECASWSCLGSVTWPAPTVATAELTLMLKEFRTGMTVSGATVKFCKLDDAACTSPTSSGTSGADGKVKISVSTGPTGVDGYFEISSPDLVTILAYVRFMDPKQFIADAELSPTVFSKDTFAALSAFAEITPDPARGHVGFLTLDCAQSYAAGVSASLTTADASSKTLYITSDGLPSSTITATTTTAFGAIVNVPPGPTNITGKVAATGQKIGSADVQVRAGAFTTVNLVPSP